MKCSEMQKQIFCCSKRGVDPGGLFFLEKSQGGSDKKNLFFDEIPRNAKTNFLQGDGSSGVPIKKFFRNLFFDEMPRNTKTNFLPCKDGGGSRGN